MYSFLKCLISTFILIKCIQAKNCTCVPFYQCDDDYTVISSRSEEFDVRNSDQCPGYLNICCDTTSTTTARTPPKRANVCGTRGPENFTWSAALLFRQYKEFLSLYKCRVSLINEKVALTAAHCLHGRGEYKVRIGSTIRDVVHIQRYSSSKYMTQPSDIALLILNKPFKLEKIGTVCVPPQNPIFNENDCTTISRNHITTDLKVTRVHIVEKNDCLEKLQESHLSTFIQLEYESLICAKVSMETDQLRRDGGSPLICPIPGVAGRYQQVGIMSWRIEHEEGAHEIYVNLGHFTGWIDEVMEENWFNTTSYKM